MREATIEKKTVEIAKKAGWLSFKWQSANQRGVPDRLFFRDGTTRVVEFKAPGKKPTKLQKHNHSMLRAHGIEVYVIDSTEAGAALFA